MLKEIADIASWLLRVLGARSVTLFLAAFAIGTLWRLPRIESALAEQTPAWSELIGPIVWAGVAASLWALGSPAFIHLRAALSPVYRFRRLASRADALADELSDGGNYYARIGVSGRMPPLRGKPRLEAKIASFKADLASLGIVLGIVPTPHATDVSAWKQVFPELRGCMSSGDLSQARARHWIVLSKEELEALAEEAVYDGRADRDPDRS